MDNFHFDMTCQGRETLSAAMRLAFSQHSKATHYAIREADDKKPRRIVFFWAESVAKGAAPFPFKMDAEGCADFAWRWLSEVDFGSEPDHDGDNGKGWRVYNEGWGHVDGEWAGIIAVAPEWAMYGK
jgi:hypothetical protein